MRRGLTHTFKRQLVSCVCRRRQFIHETWETSTKFNTKQWKYRFLCTTIITARWLIFHVNFHQFHPRTRFIHDYFWCMCVWAIIEPTSYIFCVWHLWVDFIRTKQNLLSCVDLILTVSVCSLIDAINLNWLCSNGMYSVDSQWMGSVYDHISFHFTALYMLQHFNSSKYRIWTVVVQLKACYFDWNERCTLYCENIEFAVISLIWNATTSNDDGKYWNIKKILLLCVGCVSSCFEINQKSWIFHVTHANYRDNCCKWVDALTAV